MNRRDLFRSLAGLAAGAAVAKTLPKETVPPPWDQEPIQYPPDMVPPFEGDPKDCAFVSGWTELTAEEVAAIDDRWTFRFEKPVRVPVSPRAKRHM